MNGILCVNKPQDFTSFDVVAKLRGILQMKRLGHGGTLDPMATGVLPVFVGSATKACDIMPDNTKSYRAGFRLGAVSDTQDVWGEVRECSDMAVSREDIEAVIPDFTGKIMQLPPMYSAVQVNGQRLYDLARQGIEVERQAREIEVDSLVLESYDSVSREGVLSIACGKGTYIRTIISDIGEKLGCGGIMTSLVRTSSGGFFLDDCHSFEEIQCARDEGRLEELGAYEVRHCVLVLAGRHTGLRWGGWVTTWTLQGLRRLCLRRPVDTLGEGWKLTAHVS